MAFIALSHQDWFLKACGYRLPFSHLFDFML